MMIKRTIKRAQVGNEMMFGVGVVLLIFILLLPASIEKKNEVDKSAIALEKINACKTFSNILARVSVTGNLNVTSAFEHNISLTAGSSIVDVEGALCTSIVDSKESMNLAKGLIEVKNVGGEVLIRNV